MFILQIKLNELGKPETNRIGGLNHIEPDRTLFEIAECHRLHKGRGTPEFQPISNTTVVSPGLAYNIKIEIGNLIMIGKGELHVPKEEHFKELIDLLSKYFGVKSNERREFFVKKALEKAIHDGVNNLPQAEMYGEKYFNSITEAFLRGNSRKPVRIEPFQKSDE